jgi:Ca2+-binding RTX toxin-like protein
MASPTGQEVLAWMLINRARLDPAAEAARYGIDLNEGLAPGTLSATTRQPLAFNNTLFSIADAHSQSMIDFDYFAHNNPTTGSTPFTRMTSAGYNFSTAGENIAWQGTTGTVDATAFIVQQMQSLFVDAGIAGRGHRTNLLNGGFQEVGVGQVIGQFTDAAQTWNTSMVTEDFGTLTRAAGQPGQFLTGVVYRDADANNFYSVGEGLGGISVATGLAGFTTETAGNYSVLTGPVSVGSGFQVSATFSGIDLPQTVRITTFMNYGTNVEIDLQLSGVTTVLRTSSGITTAEGVDRIEGLGASGLSLTGGSRNETIIGTNGNDYLNGAGGSDTLSGGLGNDILDGGNDGIGGNQADALNGGDGVDTITYLSNSAGVSVFLKSGYANEGGGVFDTLSGIENVTGTWYNDTFEGDANANFIDGYMDFFGVPSSDTVYYASSATGVTVNLITNVGSGGDAAGDTYRSIENVVGSDTGNDVLTGGAEANFFTSGGGNDTLDGGAGGDSLLGGDGNDLLKPGDGFDYVVGGNGIDTVDYSTSTTGVGVHLVYGGGFGGDAAGDGITGVENVMGSLTGADSIYGDDAANNLMGQGGDDTLFGSAGADIMNGGAGTGDTAYYFASVGQITANLASGVGAGGDAAGDTYIGIENIIGSNNFSFGDTLTGNSASNFINGYGGADTINGGLGNDTLYGGVNADTFRFTDTLFGFDTIGDWEDGQDKISLGTGVATSMAQVTITTLTATSKFVTIGTQGFTVNSASAFTLDAGDFLFV